MASIYVKVTSLEDALKYFDAGVAYWWSVANELWLPQTQIANSRFPPTEYEVNSGSWAILVEDEDV